MSVTTRSRTGTSQCNLPCRSQSSDLVAPPHGAASALPLLSLCFWDHPISAGPYPLQRRVDNARILSVMIRLPKQRLDSISATGFLSIHPVNSGGGYSCPVDGRPPLVTRRDRSPARALPRDSAHGFCRSHSRTGVDPFALPPRWPSGEQSEAAAPRRAFRYTGG